MILTIFFIGCWIAIILFIMFWLEMKHKELMNEFKEFQKWMKSQKFLPNTTKDEIYHLFREHKDKTFESNLKKWREYKRNQKK